MHDISAIAILRALSSADLERRRAHLVGEIGRGGAAQANGTLLRRPSFIVSVAASIVVVLLSVAVLEWPASKQPQMLLAATTSAVEMSTDTVLYARELTLRRFGSKGVV